MSSTARSSSDDKSTLSRDMYNKDAEVSVLGAVLLSRDALEEARAILGDDPSAFYCERHGSIWAAMLALFRDGKPIDTLLLTDYLVRETKLDATGWKTCLSEISGKVPTSANVEHYARKVRDTADRRLVNERLHACITQLQEGDLPAEVLRSLDPLRDAIEVRDSGHNCPDEWPAPLEEEAFYGLAGDFVRLVEPHSEADPAALLLSFLVGAGCAVGLNAHFDVSGAPHPARLFCALIGATSTGRKGTSLAPVKRVLKMADPDFANCIASGLQSGEGLIHHVRDATESDPGISDKRLLVLEEELSGPLSAGSRQGSTLSPTLRLSWDTDDLRSLAKNSGCRATGAHVCLIGHCTPDELRRMLSDNNLRNGFANRFIWFAVRASKELPDGGNLTESALSTIAEKLTEAIRFAKQLGEIRMDDEAAEVWRGVYGGLRAGRPGLIGIVTDRRPAQVKRVALVYALLDLSDEVRLEHLNAALAVIKFADASAASIFGLDTGDRIADRILSELRERPDGMTRTEMYDLFDRHVRREDLETALPRLIEDGLVREQIHPSGGRPSRRYFPVGGIAN